jgi:DNA-binding transcriptional MerR regulator
LNKAPDAFRTISEVAEELDLPQHVLRFWESRFPHIKPLKRGGGRRYYRPEDVDLLRGIRRLLYSDGYTIKGVQRILREQGVGTVQSVGQGQELNLAAVRRGDAGDGDDRPDGAAAAPEIVTPQDSREQDSQAPDEGEDEREGEDGRAAAPALLRPKNGRIAKVNSPPVGAVASLEAGPADQARIAVHRATDNNVGVSDTGVGHGDFGHADFGHGAVSIAAVNQVVATPPTVVMPAPPAMAVQHLDRLKRALADLEACRRLLEKAIEGGR